MTTQRQTTNSRNYASWKQGKAGRELLVHFRRAPTSDYKGALHVVHTSSTAGREQPLVVKLITSVYCKGFKYFARAVPVPALQHMIPILLERDAKFASR